MLPTGHCCTAHADLVSAMHLRKTTSVQLQPRMALTTDWQAQSRDLSGRLGRVLGITCKTYSLIH